jgi:serine phosphatase RsbU (regulator of sigma subunit)/CheY-like chemotaxis protein
MTTTTPAGTRTVVVVDDTAAHRYVMATWLRGAGVHVVEAGTGAEALALVTADTDAVVLDVNLPDLSGREVCRRIKDAEATARVPVLHVSATDIDAAARTAGLQGGADAYLAEPLDRAEFLATLDTLCRGHEQVRGIGRSARRLELLGESLVRVHRASTYEEAVDRLATGAAAVLERGALAMVVVDPTTVLRALRPAPGAPLVRGTGSSPVLPPGPAGPTHFPADAVPEPWQRLADRAGLEPAGWWTVWLHDDEGVLVGGLALCADDAQDVSAEDRAAVERFIGAASVALANLRTYTEEHGIAMTLQRTMLPARLGEHPGLDVAARYVASDARLDVGGDFYDAFDLPDGRVAVVIGDVQGHSLRAATVMAEVRLTLRAYLREGHTAERALHLLNETLRADHREMATLCLCLVDPGTGAAEVTDAGHLPALLVRADGTVETVKRSSRLLGLPSPDERAPAEVVLAPGDQLLLVTDGLIERRESTLRDGLDRLATAAAATAGQEPDDVCHALLARFDDVRDDDVAIVVARRTPRGQEPVGTSPVTSS